MIFKDKIGTPKKGWVVLVHGLGEHSGRYKKLIQMLNNQGFGVYTFDWPGHGKSSGKKGHTIIPEGIDIIDHIIEEIGEKPLLFGHSLGGTTVLRYAQYHPEKIKGIVASAPSLALPENVSNAMATFAKIFGIILPSVTMNNRLDPNTISRNKEAVERYKNDPLVHDRASNAFTRSLFTEMIKAQNEVEKITKPILLLGGTSDVIAPIKGTQKFFENLKVKDKTMKEYHDGYHELFEDEEWGEPFHKTIVEWIKNH